MSTLGHFCCMKNSSIIHLKENKDAWSRMALRDYPMNDFSIFNPSFNQKRICTHMTTMPNCFINCKQEWSSNTSVPTYLHFPVTALPSMHFWQSTNERAESMSVVNKSEPSQRIYIQPCLCLCVCPSGANRAWCWMIQVCVCKRVCGFLYICALYIWSNIGRECIPIGGWNSWEISHLRISGCEGNTVSFQPFRLIYPSC